LKGAGSTFVWIRPLSHAHNQVTAKWTLATEDPFAPRGRRSDMTGDSSWISNPSVHTVRSRCGDISVAGRRRHRHESRAPRNRNNRTGAGPRSCVGRCPGGLGRSADVPARLSFAELAPCRRIPPGRQVCPLTAASTVDGGVEGRAPRARSVSARGRQARRGRRRAAVRWHASDRGRAEAERALPRRRVRSMLGRAASSEPAPARG